MILIRMQNWLLYWIPEIILKKEEEDQVGYM